jgi:NADH-quinone oxidoreductase subunit A
MNMSNSALFLVLFITALVLVVAALVIAWLLAPRSHNFLKGQVYECGIPTRGSSQIQFKVGYYLFAILFLVFDVETVLLFPWAVVMQKLGIDGLICAGFFLVILTLGLVYAWKKGVLQWK